MSRLRTILASVTALAGLLSLTACGALTPVVSTPSASPSPTYAVTGDGVLRIGTILPSAATAQVAGVEVAVREINEAGGINGVPVELFHRTSGDAATETAEASLTSLVAKGVDVIIGPASPELAERLIAPATAANVALISPSALGLGEVEDSGLLFSTAVGAEAGTAAMARALASADSASVAFLATDDDVADLELTSLTSSLEVAEGAVAVSAVFSAATTDFASVVAKVKKAKPDAIVVSTATTEQAVGLLAALDAAGFGGSAVWLTPRSTVDYSPFLAAGILEGATGFSGVALDEAFVARLRQADPSLSSFAYAAESYDATVLATLAVLLGGDDGGPAISRHLRSASLGGIPCASVGECMSVLATEPDVDYVGRSGPVDLSEAGDAFLGAFTAVTYSNTNGFTAE